MKEDFHFSHRLKVRYSEIDGQKIVFNAHYLTYLDITVGDYFDEGLKVDLHELAEGGVFDFVLAKSTLEYKNSARLGDWLDIWCRTDRIGKSSFTLKFLITRVEDETPILEAEIIYVCYNTEKRSSQPIPTLIREKISSFEDKDF
jgi:acyl-CoA thioester hydrolase